MAKTIMVVDDEKRLVSLVESYLTQEGYRVVSAYNGAEALTVAQKEKPDLIILDVMMEDIVAGFRVVNALRNFEQNPQNRRYETVPILMLTSIQQRTKMKFAQDAGSKLLPIDAFMEKPVRPKELLDKVASLLKK